MPLNIRRSTNSTSLCEMAEMRILIDNDAVRFAKPETDNDGLSILGVKMVEFWEEPAQKEMALLAMKNSSNVLEVGFGLGLASKYLNSHTTLNHTLIELNKVLALEARKRLENTHVYNADWRDAIKVMETESFDAILFDAFPFDLIHQHNHYFEYNTWVEGFLLELYPYLSRDGSIMFLDMTCALDFENLLEALPYSAYETTSVSVNISQSCSYAKGEKIDVVTFKK